jgi:hypothetical protein
MKEFKSPGAFAKHLVALASVSHEVVHHMVDKSAEEIQKTAAGMLGDYQDAIGPYPKWEELADSTKAERARLGYSDNDPGYRSGEMKRSIGRAVNGSEATIGSNDQHLVWFELGTSKQPPRPVLGPAALHSKERFNEFIGKTTRAWICGMGWRRPGRLKPP